MKKKLLILLLIIWPASMWAQNNLFTLSGGYSFANIKESSQQGTGYTIVGTFEMNQVGSKYATGISFGFVSLSASEMSLNQEVKYTVSSYPVYFSPKYIFGDGKLRPFIKGDIGMQYSDLKREIIDVVHVTDFGFYGGGGAGIMVLLGEKFFINAEYNIDWASNSAYNDGWIQTAKGGLGIRF
jgi:hypothetical protein